MVGKTIGPYSESGKVLVQIKETAGAAFMSVLSKYPHAAATMHPTSRPQTTDVDFINGEPKRSHRMMETKTRKPRPINSALPQGSGCGAALEGQSWKGPSAGWDIHGPEPPAQFVRAEAMSLTPMSMTVGPVTSGGNSFFSTLVGIKLNAISKRAQSVVVPRIAP